LRESFFDGPIIAITISGTYNFDLLLTADWPLQTENIELNLVRIKNEQYEDHLLVQTMCVTTHSTCCSKYNPVSLSDFKYSATHQLFLGAAELQGGIKNLANKSNQQYCKIYFPSF